MNARARYAVRPSVAMAPTSAAAGEEGPGAASRAAVCRHCIEPIRPLRIANVFPNAVVIASAGNALERALQSNGIIAPGRSGVGI